MFSDSCNGVQSFHALASGVASEGGTRPGERESLADRRCEGISVWYAQHGVEEDWSKVRKATRPRNIDIGEEDQLGVTCGNAKIVYISSLSCVFIGMIAASTSVLQYSAFGIDQGSNFVLMLWPSLRQVREVLSPSLQYITDTQICSAKGKELSFKIIVNVAQSRAKN